MDPMIKSAEERLLRLSSDEETLRLYEAREEALIEYNSAISAARRAGEKKGLEEGEKKGKMEGKLETAKNLLSLGVDINSIAKATGLSKSQIQKL